MERGLLWLPLLVLFIALTWAGWNEYQKVEAYQRWAQAFDRAKYDIYAVLGQKGSKITWGKPTRSGPIDLQTFSLKEVREICLFVDGDPADWNVPPSKGRSVDLEFSFADETDSVKVPFTDIALAAEWGKCLEGERMKILDRASN